MKTKVQITVSNSKAKALILENHSFYDSSVIAKFIEDAIDEAFLKSGFSVSYKTFEQSFTVSKLEELIG